MDNILPPEIWDYIFSLCGPYRPILRMVCSLWYELNPHYFYLLDFISLSDLHIIRYMLENYRIPIGKEEILATIRKGEVEIFQLLPSRLPLTKLIGQSISHGQARMCEYLLTLGEYRSIYQEYKVAAGGPEIWKLFHLPLYPENIHCLSLAGIISLAQNYDIPSSWIAHCSSPATITWFLNHYTYGYIHISVYRIALKAGDLPLLKRLHALDPLPRLYYCYDLSVLLWAIEQGIPYAKTFYCGKGFIDDCRYTKGSSIKAALNGILEPSHLNTTGSQLLIHIYLAQEYDLLSLYPYCDDVVQQHIIRLAVYHRSSCCSALALYNPRRLLQAAILSDYSEAFHMVEVNPIIAFSTFLARVNKGDCPASLARELKITQYHPLFARDPRLVDYFRRLPQKNKKESCSIV